LRNRYGNIGLNFLFIFGPYPNDYHQKWLCYRISCIGNRDRVQRDRKFVVITKIGFFQVKNAIFFIKKAPTDTWGLAPEAGLEPATL
jgi:hypothetical protein